MERTATLSDCGAYRYTLGRTWDPEFPVMRWIMLNPSTADAEVDDPTIRRCVSFAQGFGFGGLVVHNLFALRATDPATLATHPDPVGPDNWMHLVGARDLLRPNPSGATRWALTVAAWGAHPAATRARDDGLSQAARTLQFLEAAGVRVHALGLTKAGYPRHPLYLKATTPLVEVRAARTASYV